MRQHTPAGQTDGMQSEEKALRCVIVDDNPAFVHAAAHFLGHQGIDIVGVASTIAEALSCVERLRPDVVVVDIHLGDESGFELAERLARGPALSPVILTSTHSELEFADMIAASPALGFVPKVELSADAVRRLLDSTIGAD
jgi:DNA-binding NarL/FixJ family response regulator